MNTLKFIVASMVLILVSAVASLAQDTGWPRQRAENGNILVTYQPQVDDWKNFRELDWRMAISLTPAGGQPVVGVAELHAQTTVDTENKMVLVSNISIKKTYFPSLDPPSAAQMGRLLGTFLPQAVTITLHQFVASVPKTESTPSVHLKNDPPAIFVSNKPAILLDVDGQPVRAPVNNTGLEYVVNTHWPLFFEKSKSEYFLLTNDQWLQATNLRGPWSAAAKLPKDMEKLPNEAQWADLKNYILLPPAKSNATVPTVFYSTDPAEIILFDGNPSYAQIPGTQLLYATNTTSYLFLDASTDRYYYLTAGRWFRANSLDGPWTFATPNLPADFSQIPADSPAAQVLASVPGTEEAKDSVLMAKIPTTVIVNPAAAESNVSVTYDGTSQFAPIQGTSLYYAVNTPQKVIKVGNLFYLCFQGVWFVSSEPQGPWQTAQNVPEQIYTIPPSSPVYNVTYVTQTVNSDGNVQASYTAGYTGVFVMDAGAGAVIAGGTGYTYPPYIATAPVYGYPVYYPTPYTYGAATYYKSATGAYGVSQTAYGPYGSATRTSSYNPYSGTYAQSTKASTAYGSTAVGQAYNPYTGAYGVTKQSSNAYSQWGSSAVTKGGETAYTQHYTTAQGSVGSAQTSAGGTAAAGKSEYGYTAAGKTGSGDMYAGHDGNVYKNTGSGWQTYNNGSWTSVQPPASASTKQQSTPQSQSPEQQTKNAQQGQQRGSSSWQSGGSAQMQRLQQEAQNRQRGAQQSQRFQQIQRSGSDGGERSSEERSFGGGSRGGEGRGRR